MINIRLEGGDSRAPVRGVGPLPGRTHYFLGGGSYIAKFDTAKSGDDSLIYARPFGQAGDVVGNSFSAIALDSKQNLWVFGNVGTATPPAPTPDAVQPKCGTGTGKCNDTYLFALDPSGAMIYDTYLGGTVNGGGGPPLDQSGTMYIDSADNIYLASDTEDIDFPTKNAAFTYANVNTAHGTGFLTKLSAGAKSILYSTYVPWLFPIVAANPDGLAAAVGIATDGFPLLGGIAGPGPDGEDTAFEVFDTTGSGTASLVTSSYLGASGDFAQAATFSVAGDLLIGGNIGFQTLPVVDAYQSTCGGSCTSGGYPIADGFVARLHFLSGKLTVSPATQSFPDTVVGTTSSVLSSTLTNGTASTIYLATATLTDSTNFIATANCNGIVVSGGSCSLTFTSSP